MHWLFCLQWKIRLSPSTFHALEKTICRLMLHTNIYTKIVSNNFRKNEILRPIFLDILNVWNKIVLNWIQMTHFSNNVVNMQKIWNAEIKRLLPREEPIDWNVSPEPPEHFHSFNYKHRMKKILTAQWKTGQ